jgi:hypothetical protein
VFELLKSCSLRRFGFGNWKSTIRKEVRVHPEYSGLEPWNGTETADIVFDDDEGELRFVFEELEYDLSAFSERAKFFIEVKTTTGACTDKFYMSGPQYQRASIMLSPSK